MDHLKGMRDEIDRIDRDILNLLSERKRVVESVIQKKMELRLPVFVAGREDQKIASFRAQAEELGLDPEFAEDFVRLMMSSSRDTQSVSEFPCATPEPRHVVYVGGDGGMGRLYRSFTERSGHRVDTIDKGSWYKLDELAETADLVVVTVPIHATEGVIERLAPKLRPETILADFTSTKGPSLQTMLRVHEGPVLGLHPMHGPDVPNLTKQLMVACPGRDPEAGAWYLEQCRLWGMQVVEADPDKHDHVMDLVQGLRHFVALLHGSFMKGNDLRPEEMLRYSSPIYRAELMMTGRIFAQDAELYADIVFSSTERREMLLSFFRHHERLSRFVEEDDKEGFVREFEAVTDFFGKFATQALHESGYLINRLADRFS